MARENQMEPEQTGECEGCRIGVGNTCDHNKTTKQDSCEPYILPPASPHKQTVEDRLETVNLLLGHVVGRVANVAEAIHTTEQGAETRQAEWVDLTLWAAKIQQKAQKTGLIVVGCLILVISTLTSVVVNLIM